MDLPKPVCNHASVKLMPPREAINRILLANSTAKGIEKGRMVRIDSTVTESNIHEPTDSSLLWDRIRVMVRQLYRFKDILTPEIFTFCDRSRAAKKRMNNIAYMRGTKKKVKLYKLLLKHTKETRDYLQVAVTKQHQTIKPMVFMVLEQEARTLLALTEKIIS